MAAIQAGGAKPEAPPIKAIMEDIYTMLYQGLNLGDKEASQTGSQVPRCFVVLLSTLRCLVVLSCCYRLRDALLFRVVERKIVKSLSELQRKRKVCTSLVSTQPMHRLLESSCHIIVDSNVVRCSPATAVRVCPTSRIDQQVATGRTQADCAEARLRVRSEAMPVPMAMDRRAEREKASGRERGGGLGGTDGGEK